MFVGKLKTSILMLSKGEVMLARAPFRFTSQYAQEHRGGFSRLDTFLWAELLEVEW